MFGDRLIKCSGLIGSRRVALRSVTPKWASAVCRGVCGSLVLCCRALRNGFFPGWPGFSRAVGIESRAATTVESPGEGRFFLSVFYVRVSLGVFGCCLNSKALGMGSEGFFPEAGFTFAQVDVGPRVNAQ